MLATIHIHSDQLIIHMQGYIKIRSYSSTTVGSKAMSWLHYLEDSGYVVTLKDHRKPLTIRESQRLDT